MSYLRSITGLACSLVLVACEGPTVPEAAPVEVALAGAEAPKSTRAPVITDIAVDDHNLIPCPTFDLQIDAVGSIRFWDWFNADGSIRSNAHVQVNVILTNVQSGDWVLNQVNFREEFLVSADGSVSISDSGIGFKVRREAKGRQIAYQVGRAVFTIDASTSPPTVQFSFNGRQDGGAGPCVDLA